jgi:NAD(P)-dependent dehydrogenase (short-subunit alcohol dehydrogenase family)
MLRGAHHITDGVTLMGKLQGKVGVITGATAGIGLTAADLIVKEGAHVFITGRRQKELDEAVRAIGHDVAGVQGDVAQLSDLDRLYETVEASGRRIDIVFANAGLGEFRALGEITEEHFDKLFSINVKGTLFTVQKALALLNDGASIILTGPVASIKGAPAFWVYGATKAAIRNFVRGWTIELKDRRIRCNVLSPGPTDTPLVVRHCADRVDRSDRSHGDFRGDRQGGSFSRFGRFEFRRRHRAFRRWRSRTDLVKPRMDPTMRQVHTMHELPRALASRDDGGPPCFSNGGASCGL